MRTLRCLLLGRPRAPRKTRILLIVSLVAAGVAAGFAVKQILFSKGLYVERYQDGRVIPLSGMLLNPSGLENLKGDAEEDFLRLHRALRNYAKQHEKLPDDPRWLIEFTKSWPPERRVEASTFGTDDYKASDTYSKADEGFNYSWAYRSPRANGLPKPAEPSGDERDVWVYTDVYVRSGRRVFRDGSFVTEPAGSYLVLWSDGQIERTRLEDRVLVSLGGRGKTYFFRGETGVPSDAEPAGEAMSQKGNWWPPPAEPGGLDRNDLR